MKQSKGWRASCCPRRKYILHKTSVPAADDTWAHSTWAVDAVGLVLGWEGLGSRSEGTPGKPGFSWSGPRWRDPATGAGGWGRSTLGNTEQEPALESGQTWPSRCSTLWRSREELWHGWIHERHVSMKELRSFFYLNRPFFLSVENNCTRCGFYWFQFVLFLTTKSIFLNILGVLTF